MSGKWDFYFCHVDGSPASIFVDMGIIDSAPVASLPYLTRLSVEILQPNDDGFPTDVDFGELSRLEDRLNECLTQSSCEAICVGRSTCNGRRDFYIYSADSNAVEEQLQVLLRSYSQRHSRIDGRHDHEWYAYREFLYPDARSRQTMHDRQVLQALQKHGDDGRIPRPVTHWAYFNDPDQAASFAKWAADELFCIVNEGVSEGEDLRFVVTLERTDAIDLDRVHQLTLPIFDAVIARGGEYDGWETAVRTDEALEGKC